MFSRPLALAALLALPGLAHAEAPRTIIVMDGSGSMWGQIDGRAKLDIARETVAEVLSRVPTGQELGLMAYGHREKGNCADIELMVPPAAGSAPAILNAVNAMRFLGKTPLSDAVREAAVALGHTEQKATVVLVTDGIETCAADPCALAAELEASGVEFTAHVIGFGLGRDRGAELACIAENTGGRYFDAGDGAALAAALNAVVAGAELPDPGPAPEAAPPQGSRHFGGAPVMPGVSLAATGRGVGEAVSSPVEAEFPPDGTAEQCRAICEADALCGSWNYEPRGSFFVDHARCHLFSTATEFNANHYPADEGFVAGMKPGVVGLLRPYVALGAPATASLAVAGPLVPGAEFTVLWSGPAGEGDWVDLVPAGHGELSGELSFFLVNETVEAGDAPEGAGTLTMPVEPGAYELRYVLGREADRRAILRVPLAPGGAAAGNPEAAVLVPVAITTPPDWRAEPVQWSATPLDPMPHAPEAVAMPEALPLPWRAELAPGRWQVEGETANGMAFRAGITVTDAPDQTFEIPVGLESEGMGEDAGPTGTSGPAEAAAPSAAAVPTETAARTETAKPAEAASGAAAAPAQAAALKVVNTSGLTLTFLDGPTGLGFALPPGWGADEPFFYQTAGGVRAARPTMGFYLAGAADPLIVLNPLRAAPGPCLATAAGDLCHTGAPVAQAAAGTIAPTLALEPAQ